MRLAIFIVWCAVGQMKTLSTQNYMQCFINLFFLTKIKSCNGGLDVKEERKDLKFGLKMFLPVRDSGDNFVISSALDLSMQILPTFVNQ